MNERYLSLAEACEVLGKSERTLYRWIKSGKLRAYKPGRDYEIPESAIQEMRERSEVYPKAPALWLDDETIAARRFTAEQMRNIAWAVMNESAALFLVVMEEIAQNVEHTVKSPDADLEALFNAQNMAIEAVGYWYAVRGSYPKDAPAPFRERLKDLEKRLKAARSEARTAFRKRRDEARRLAEEDSLKVVNLREEKREEWRRDAESATA